MTLASLKGRVARLDAKHRIDASQVKGVIASRFGHLVPDPDKPGHLKLSEHPDGFEAWAASQQNALQVELVALSLTGDEPKRGLSVGKTFDPDEFGWQDNEDEPDDTPKAATNLKMKFN